MAAPPLTERVAPDILRVPILFVNAYFVGEAGGPWVLVDTGLPGAAAYLRKVAGERFGQAPEAILLTHGHFDHAGNAEALAQAWDVPIYAHGRELPFLTGRSDYPPTDPTMGGAIAFLARSFPTSGYDFGDRVQTLPEDGGVPHLPEWQWHHTPGHTPGHVSLWREGDRTLLAGDALATMDLDSWTTQVTHARELARPPAPFTPDWDDAEESIVQLEALAPRTIGAGHGRAMRGEALPQHLHRFAGARHRPAYGRYAHQPARFDADLGTVALPPEVPDPVLRNLAATSAGSGLAALLARRAAWRA